ncbi:hypothetical protein [Aquimonas sp.]|jgi:hypothetical protein|uniref:hypothetical protein n=1 Tax=Aquimonas sp. TaxID=1872588 RepID=UPI0037BF020F
MNSFRKTLLATSCILAFAGQASATVVTEAFDGSWTDSRAIGQNKGLLLDVLPDQNLVFGAFFTYANDGTQIWAVISPSLVQGRNDYTNVPVLRYTGGRFSEAGSPVEQALGTANVSFSCDGITMNVTPTAGSNLAPANFVFVPSLGLKKLTSGQCNDVAATCPAGTTADGSDCRLPGSITNNLFLPAGKKYIVRGQVTVENNGRLTIAPGVTVQGSTDVSSPNFIAVKQGGRMYAEGTPTQPITFTGPEARPGSWAGIVMNGRSICNDATATTPCRFEAVPELVYGAVPPVLDDSSGALRYVRILWAGQQIAPNEELNALTLNAVGSGTVLEYVQVDGGLDDGFEFFGGSINGRHLVCSNMGDDCFDFDQGYNGKIQFALGWQGVNPDQGGDSNGVESDNDNPASDKTPRTQPVVSNLTLVGRGDVGNEGMRIRRGSGGNYSNLVVTGFRDRCVNLVDAQTYALSSATQTGSTLTLANSWVGTCLNGAFEDAATAAYAVSAWYNAGTGNGTGNPLLVTGGFLPTSTSPLLSGGQAPSDGFFRPVQFRGAFAGPRDNWTSGWTVNIPR